MNFGVEPIVNASGTVTRLSGARMRNECVEAIVQAAKAAYCIEEVQASACRVISRITGAEAGLVTCGAAAGLMLGTAAILCRYDFSRMESLPFLHSGPNEFIVARSHRNGYDHAVRAAGARLVEVGFDDVASGAGVRRVEVWEYEIAIRPQTAGILFVATPESHSFLSEVVRMAQRHGVPILVDAAGQLPPASNLQSLVQTGADLVVFSGGKAIGGPQATGILCGKRELVGSAFLQMIDLDEHFELWSPPAEFVDKSMLPGIPRHGIGRMLKVSSEQIVGLLAAIERFIEVEKSEQQSGYQEVLELVAHELNEKHFGLSFQPGAVPELHIELKSHLLPKGVEACRLLRAGSPRIFVGHGLLHKNILVINPMCLNAQDAVVVGNSIAALLKV